MDKQLELSRWRDRPEGVGYRRLTIIKAGVLQLLRIKLIGLLVIVSWILGFGIAALGFVVSQSVATGGWLEQMIERLPDSGEPQAIVSIIGAMLTLYPDVWVHAVFSAIFWLHSYAALALSLVAVTVIIPHLMAKDRSTGAMVIYLSRPLTSIDYLLSKLGVIAAMLFLTWVGPLLFGWISSVALAPDTDFIIYSIPPLLRALAYSGLAFAVLAALALAVSALNTGSAGAIMTWVGLWLLAGALANFDNAPPWLKRASFTYDLRVLRKEAFRLDEALAKLPTTLPLPDRQFSMAVNTAATSAVPEPPAGALVGLAFFVVGSSFVFTRRIRPE